jgi:hypothetical protein
MDCSAEGCALRSIKPFTQKRFGTDLWVVYDMLLNAATYEQERSTLAHESRYSTIHPIIIGTQNVAETPNTSSWEC